MSRAPSSAHDWQGVHRGLRIRLDLEVVDPAERRAQLVLDPALDAEDVDLEPMRGVGDVAGRRVLGAHGGQRAQQRDRDRRRRTRAAAGRDGGTHA